MTDQMALALAKSSRTPKDIIGDLVTHPSGEVRKAVAQHRHAGEFYHQMDPAQKQVALAHGKAPREAYSDTFAHVRREYGPVLQKFGYTESEPGAKQHPGRLRYNKPGNKEITIGHRPLADKTVQRNYRGDFENKWVHRGRVGIGWVRRGEDDITGTQGESPEELQRHLTRIHAPEIKAAQPLSAKQTANRAAMGTVLHHDAPADLLHSLAGHPHPDVVRGVASHPNTPPATKAILRNHKDPDIANLASGRTPFTHEDEHFAHGVLKKHGFRYMGSKTIMYDRRNDTVTRSFMGDQVKLRAGRTHHFYLHPNGNKATISRVPGDEYERRQGREASDKVQFKLPGIHSGFNNHVYAAHRDAPGQPNRREEFTSYVKKAAAAPSHNVGSRWESWDA
jgi:hypothetical protein